MTERPASATAASKTTQPAVTVEAAGSRKTLRLALVPIVLFALLAAVFAYALQHSDPSRLPSVLLGKPAPAFSLPGIEGLVENGQPVAGLERADLVRGKPSIVNVWASWCGPCHEEHPYLTALAERAGPDVVLFGLNYKDKPEAARRFLIRYGNPYARIGADLKGRTAIDFGVYGVPETYLIDGDGNIAYRHVGPIRPEHLDELLLPLLKKIAAGTTDTGASPTTPGS